MSRRPINPARRLAGNGGFSLGGAFLSKTRSSPVLSVTLVLLGVFFFFFLATCTLAQVCFRSLISCTAARHLTISVTLIYICRKEVVSRIEGEFSGTLEAQRAIPILKKTYGDAMRKVLHVGPDTYAVVSKLLKEEDTEAWGVEPYEAKDADASCKSLIVKGVVRVADVKFPLPYSSKSFSLVIVSDTLDYLSPKYLNKTVPELARVASDGVVIFTGHPRQQSARVVEPSKFGRPSKMRSQSWWVGFFLQIGLEENDSASKKFEQAATKASYKPSCQVFHLKSLH